MRGQYYYDSPDDPSADTLIIPVRYLQSLKISSGGDNVGALFIKMEKISRNLKVLRGRIVPVPKEQWVKIKTRVYYHATLGSVTVWQGDVCVIHANGFDTIGSTQPDRAGFAQTGGTHAAFWDDIKASKNDPDNP
jgi:hypothetical protein